MKYFKKKLFQDLVIISLSVAFAVFLMRADALYLLLSSGYGNGFISSFISGMFFTSLFTTAPAIVALGEISQIQPTLYVAFFGALGAVLGDVLLFMFIRDRFSDDLMELFRKKKEKKIKVSEHIHIFRWLSFFLGGLVIASPLPDELGIGLLGLSKVNMRLFVPVSFIFNFAGIVLIGIAANSL